MSFVGHIKVKESPSKMLKLIVYLSVFFLPQSDLFAYNTRPESFLGVTRTISENNLLTRPFEKLIKKLSISPQLNTLEETG